MMCRVGFPRGLHGYWTKLMWFFTDRSDYQRPLVKNRRELSRANLATQEDWNYGRQTWLFEPGNNPPKTRKQQKTIMYRCPQGLLEEQFQFLLFLLVGLSVRASPFALLWQKHECLRWGNPTDLVLCSTSANISPGSYKCNLQTR